MITEEEYLKALEIVKAYQQQVNKQVETINIDDPCIGDIEMKPSVYWGIYYLLKDKIGNNSWNSSDAYSLKLKTLVDNVSIRELMAQRHIGKKSIIDLQSELKGYGLKLREI